MTMTWRPRPQPSVLSRIPLNDAQREAVEGREDLIVTAGAGTGKTRTLVARYLGLLEAGLPLRGILAITFTRKAAREMRNRLRQEIGQWLAAAPVEQRPFWQSCYADLDTAYIGTIHSLCSRILRAHPAEAAIDPLFETLDESDAAILKNQVIDNTLRWAADDNRFRELFHIMGVSNVILYLNGLIAAPQEAMAAWQAMGDDPLAHWQVACESMFQRFWLHDETQALFDNLRLLDRDGYINAAEAKGDKLAGPLRALLQARRQIDGCRARGDWAGVCTTLAVLKGNMPNVGRTANWPAMPAAKDVVKALKARYAAQIEPWFAKADWAADQQVAALLPALRRLFEQAIRAYNHAKVERGSVDYDDLERRTLELLQGHPEIAAAWRARIQALLVDEFQDTNQRQRQLVDLLTQGEANLFVVGDAKQSIYRFRGADVTVFRATQQEIVANQGRHLRLQRTYRAHYALVAKLNRLLEPMLDVESDAPYAVPFEPLQAAKAEPPAGLRPPYIEMVVGVGENADQGRQVAAQALVERLAELGSGGVPFGHMALLFRASTTFYYYEDALEAAGIPFVTVAGRGFFDRPEIRDLLNGLQALADPSNDVAMAGLLRSPGIGLTDEALFRLRWSAQDEPVPFWQALRDAVHALDDSEQAVATWTRETLEPLHQVVGRLPIATVLKRLLDTTNYRAILQRQGNQRALRNVDKLLADAHQSQAIHVGAFLDYIRVRRDVATREGEAPVEAEGAAQLMTIHQAKGLEFPVVVMADLNRGNGGGGQGLLLSPKWGWLLPLKVEDNHGLAYGMAQQEEAAMEAAESARLFYVAATRAAGKLILSGHGTVKKNGRLSANGWLGQIWELFDGQLAPKDGSGWDRPTRTPLMLRGAPWLEAHVVGAHPLAQVRDDTGSSDETDDRKGAAPLSTPWLTSLLPSTPHAATEDDQEQETTRRSWRVVPDPAQPRAQSWIVGRMVHGALQRWCTEGEALTALLQTQGRSLGLVNEQALRDGMVRAQRLLGRFRQHPLYEEMSQASIRHHELPYEYDDEGSPHHVIDALYQRQDSQWVVVDFKTDRIRGAKALTERIDRYKPQVEGYVRDLSAMLGVTPQAQLVFLDVDAEVKIVPVQATGSPDRGD